MLLSASYIKWANERAIERRRSRRSFLFLLPVCLAMLASLPAPSSALAQADGGPSAGAANSLDSLWVDQAAKNAGAHQGNAQAQTADAKPDAAASPAPDAAAPMCKLNTFKDSALVSKGGWPGLGPFTSTDNASDFVDNQQNHLRIDLDGDQISHAQLTLEGWQSSSDIMVNVLNLQMDTDFLLEALGVKPARIQDLNVQIEKKRDSIFRDDQPVSITTGRYQIAIGKKQLESSSIPVISINSLDANRKLIKQADGSGSAASPVAVAPAVARSVAPSVVAPVDRNQLKSEFVQLITDWQRVKREALLANKTEKLEDVLAGKALSRQISAINWLVSHHEHYDMAPKSVSVDQFTEILPGKKFMVAAQVHEGYKIVDEQGNKVLKEVDDTNRVNYTVEKIGGKWMITDSALLSVGQPQHVLVDKTRH